MNSFKVSNFLIGNPLRTFIIAEIGINHDGSFSKCLKMIKLAAKSGANAVKIQTVDHNESYENKTKSYKEFKNKNFSNNQIKRIIKLSKKLNLIFFSTPGDLKSFKRLADLKVPIIKVSSGLSNNFPLIREIIKKKIPLIISTGFSERSDLIDLKKFLNKFKFKKISILKCSSKYPLPYKEVNMDNLHQIQKIFKYPIGYSDHSLGIMAPVVAVAKGARIIEKHFTLDNKAKGADHNISLKPKKFAEMVRYIRETEKIIGSNRIKLSKDIKKNKKKSLRILAAKCMINKGDKLSLENIKFVRPNKPKGKNPKFFFKLENKKSKKKFYKDQII